MEETYFPSIAPDVYRSDAACETRLLYPEPSAYVGELDVVPTTAITSSSACAIAAVALVLWLLR